MISTIGLKMKIRIITKTFAVESAIWFAQNRFNVLQSLQRPPARVRLKNQLEIKYCVRNFDFFGQNDDMNYCEKLTYELPDQLT